MILGVYPNKGKCAFGLVLCMMCFGLISDARALTLDSASGVTLDTNGACTAASPSSFAISLINLTGTNADHAIGDVYSFYLVDGANTILHSNWGSVPVGTTYSNIGPFTSPTNIDPASGPFRRVFLDDTTPGAQAAGGTLVENSVFLSVPFDANALDGDCPVDPSANAAPEITGGDTANVNAAENQTAVTDVQTSDDIDSEGSGLSYSFSTKVGGADNGLFNIDANTGVVTFKTAPDFETPGDANNDNDYEIEVNVVDSGGLRDLQNITVSVTDVIEDTVDPTVAIEGAPTSHDGATPFVVTVRFDEPVTGFTDGELTATNATVGPLSPAGGAGTVFTSTVTPTGPADIALNVAAGVAQDAAFNPNEAAATVLIGSTIVEDTKRVIKRFVGNRANHMLSNQPRIGGYLTGANKAGGGSAGNLSVDGDVSNFQMAFSTSLSKVSSDAAKKNRLKISPTSGKGIDPLNRSARKFDVWTEVYGSRSKSGNSKSSLWVGYLGVHYFATSDLIVGGLVQLDWASEKDSSTDSTANGNGWMIGPYLAGRVPGKNLFFEARGSWGKSHNKISPIGTFTDKFKTERWMLSGKVSGLYEIDTLAIKPEVGVTWFEETQKNYTDSLGNRISSQGFTLGEVRFGPRFIKTIKLKNGSQIQPSIGLNGVWNFGIDNNAAAQGFVLGDNQLRARVDAGLIISNAGGINITATSFYDGFGIRDYYSYGGSLKLTIPLN